MRCVPRTALVTVLFLRGLTCLAQGAPPAATSASRADISAARRLFERNLDAIERKDRAAYLGCYLNSESLARTGPEGPRLGYADHAAQSSDDSWPDLFEARDLQLVPVRPGVVYGTYRYRVRYGPTEDKGISERVFLETRDGWKIAVTSAFPAPAGTPPPPRALVGATLLDGNGGPPIADSAIVMRGGKIDCAGTRAACPVPEGIETTDLPGRFITPGLVDAHIHLSQTGWADGRPDFIDVRDQRPYEEVQAGLRTHPERWFRSYLCSGVTALFDVGGYPWTWDARGRAEADTRAPHLSSAGPLLSTLDFWLNLPAERQFIHLADPEAGRKGARYLASHGADAVKVWFIVRPDMDFDAMAAAVTAAGEEARKLELPLIVHATGLREAKTALRAGAHLLVHSVWDEPVDEEFLTLARQSGAVYCPTLTVADGYGRLHDAATARRIPEVDDAAGCVDQEMMDLVATTASIPLDKLPSRPPDIDERAAARRRTMAENLRRIHAAGIPIAMGTDAGNPLTLHGPSVHAEMEAMEAAGLSPMDVLVASTRGGAMAMGRLDELGTVEAGKAADLLVLEADPARSAASFRTVLMVIRGGEARTLDELRLRSVSK